MQTYDVRCPICGRLNRGLYLEETEGRMECDRCRMVSEVHPVKADERIMIPMHIVEKRKMQLAII